MKFKPGAAEIVLEGNFRTGKDIVEIIRLNFKGEFIIYENNTIIHEKDTVNSTIILVKRIHKKKKKSFYR